MEESGDNMHMVDTQRLERQIGKLEERVASFSTAMDKLLEMLPELKESLRWVATEKALDGPRKERWERMESRINVLEQRNAEFEKQLVRQQEKEANNRWITGVVTSLITAVLAALIVPLFTKGH